LLLIKIIWCYKISKVRGLSPLVHVCIYQCTVSSTYYHCSMTCTALGSVCICVSTATGRVNRPCMLCWNQLLIKFISFLFHTYYTWHLWLCQTTSHVTLFHPSRSTSQLNPLISLSNRFWIICLVSLKVIPLAGHLKFVPSNSLIHVPCGINIRLIAIKKVKLFCL
jgi:hypothetical protein